MIGCVPSSDTLEDLYELSPVQEGLLFHSLLSPQNGLYVTQVSCCWRDLRIAELRRAWQEGVARHPALRTAFIWEGIDNPLQYVSRGVELPVVELDFSSCDAGERRRRLDDFLAEDRRLGFDLRAPPLMRLTLIRFADDLY